MSVEDSWEEAPKEQSQPQVPQNEDEWSEDQDLNQAGYMSWSDLNPATWFSRRRKNKVSLHPHSHNNY